MSLDFLNVNGGSIKRTNISIKENYQGEKDCIGKETEMDFCWLAIGDFSILLFP